MAARSSPPTQPFVVRHWIAVLGILASVAFIVLMVLAAPATFRGDDWDLLHGRSVSDLPSLLRPFNEQWVTIPALVVRPLLAVVGFDSYFPYVAVLLVIHIAVAAGVARLVHATSGPIAAIAAGAVTLFLGVGNENLHQAFQIGMVLAVALGIWAIAAASLRQRHGLAALLLTIAIASHLVAVAFVVACGIVAILRPTSKIRSLAWYAVPIVTLGIWVVLFDLPSLQARGGSLAASIWVLPVISLAGLFAAAGATVGAGVQGGVVVLAGIVGIAVLIARRPARPDLAAAAVGAILAEFALVGLSRGSLGLGIVEWSRYIYAAVPLVLVGLGAWFGTLPSLDERWRRPAAAVVAGLAVVAVAGNLLAYMRDRPTMEAFAQRERAAIAVLTSVDGARQPRFDVHIPQAIDLRNLLQEHGNPLADALVPGVVGSVPRAIAEDVCNEMVDPPAVEACVSVVAEKVGVPSQP